MSLNEGCRTDTVIPPDDGHTVARDVYRKEINILGKIVHQVCFIYKIIQCVPLATEPGISLIILPPMKIL